LSYYHYAVIENNKVVDVIVAETQELAESLTKKTCIGYDIDSSMRPMPGWDLIDGNLFPPKPHTSLTRWNTTHLLWEPPTDRPAAGDGKAYYWDTSTSSWAEKTQDPGTVI